MIHGRQNNHLRLMFKNWGWQQKTEWLVIFLFYELDATSLFFPAWIQMITLSGGWSSLPQPTALEDCVSDTTPSLNLQAFPFSKNEGVEQAVARAQSETQAPVSGVTIVHFIQTTTSYWQTIWKLPNAPKIQHILSHRQIHVQINWQGYRCP